MSQEPVTVTYSLEEILGEIKQSIKQVNQKLDNFQENVDQKFDTFQKNVDQKFDTFQKDVDQKFDTLQKDVDQKFDTLQKDVTDLKIGQARTEERLSGDIKSLDATVEGLSKRLDYQEFVNRGVIIGLIIAILGGLAKLLGIIGNP